MTDEAIQKHLFSAEWYQNSKRICAYVSCASLREVVTSHILSDLLGKQRQYAGEDTRWILGFQAFEKIQNIHVSMY